MSDRKVGLLTAVLCLVLLMSLVGVAIDLSDSKVMQDERLEAAIFHRPVTITVMSSQHITATSGQSTAYGVGYYREALGYIYTTVAVDTITYTFQSSPDQSTWFDHTEVTPVSATGGVSVPLTTFGPFLRVDYAVSGTTDVTSTVWLALKE